MKTDSQPDAGASRKTAIKKILLLSGLISAVFYVITDLIASCSYTGYRILDQNYSELLATGAPTRNSMLVASVFYNLFVAAFAIGILNLANPKRTSKITGLLMIGYAILSMVTPAFFQMDMRGAEITPLGGLHPVMTAVMSLFILLSIGFGGFLLTKPFRIYSFITIVLLIVFGFLTGLQAPRLQPGLATPWMGLTERINIYATMIWFGILSVKLFRKEKQFQNGDR